MDLSSFKQRLSAIAIRRRSSVPTEVQDARNALPDDDSEQHFTGATPPASHQPLLDGITWSALSRTAGTTVQPHAPPGAGGPDVLAVANMLHAGGQKHSAEAKKAADISCEPLVWQLPELSIPHQVPVSRTAGSKGTASTKATSSAQDISWGAKRLEPSDTIPAMQSLATAASKGSEAAVRRGRHPANAGFSGFEHARRVKSQPHASQQQSLPHAPNSFTDSPIQQADVDPVGEGFGCPKPKLRELQARMTARHAARKGSIHNDLAAAYAERTATNGRDDPSIPESQVPMPRSLQQGPPPKSSSRVPLVARGPPHGASVPGRTTSVGVLQPPGSSTGGLLTDSAKPRKVQTRTGKEVLAATVQRRVSAHGAEKPAPSNVSKWQAKSAQLRLAMRAARGGPGSDQAAAALMAQAQQELVPCPHCGRSYSPVAAERHIPACANMINKPSRLLAGAAKHRKNGR